MYCIYLTIYFIFIGRYYFIDFMINDRDWRYFSIATDTAPSYSGCMSVASLLILTRVAIAFTQLDR